MRFLCRAAPLAGLLIGLVAPSPTFGQHFSDCLDPTDAGTSATVVVPDTVTVALPDGTALEAGDELALYTADSTCAGRSPWTSDEDPVTITATGPNSAAGPESISDYEVGAPLRLVVWDDSRGREYDVGTALGYVPCGPDAPLCRDDGRYETGTLFTVRRIGAADRLPVELTNFVAVRQEDRARLTWTTSRETDNAGFEVQHRPPESPRWTVLQFVEAPSSPPPIRYRYTTSTLRPGRHLFRLRQVDTDGRATLSDTAAIVRAMDVPASLSAVRPHPVQSKSTATLYLRRRQHVTAALFNVLRQSVRRLLEGTLASDRRHLLPIRARGLPSGAYVLRVRGEHFSVTRRIVVVR